jgi:AcrR family transcriptional regulator
MNIPAPLAESLKSRGRPRDEALDEKITEVALAELADHGYHGMSVDSVAQRAGVGKATIYRRYRDKADLVTAAISCQKAPMPPPHSESTARKQLVAILKRARKRMIDEGNIRTLMQVLAEADRNPELIALHRERTIAARRSEFEAILVFGIERGEIRADVDRSMVAELCVGAWMGRYAIGNEFTAKWAENVIDLLWPGIAAN